MATLREIRSRITAVKSTSKITQAMRMVAAAKLRRAQDAITSARPFADQLHKILSNLASAETEFVHPFFEGRKSIQSALIVVVTSDRGLCGSFNVNVFRHVRERIKQLENDHPGIQLTIAPVGRKATVYFAKGSLHVERSYPDVFTKLEFSTAEDIANIASDGFLAGRYDRVEILHSEFVSVIKQDVRSMQLLPILPSIGEGGETSTVIDYIFEPSKADILDALLPQYLRVQVWRSLLDSNAAEQAARMMASSITGSVKQRSPRRCSRSSVEPRLLLQPDPLGFA
jgi:F-type H+-transporting ATPase subunit gamma